jgi:multidrug efflux pump
MQQLTQNLDGFVGAKIFIDKEENGPPTGPPVNIDISGDEFSQLVMLAEDFVRIIQDDRIPGIDELKMNINVNQPEMMVKVDREKARLYELTTQQIAMTFRNALYGYDAGTLKDGEEEYDIFIRMAEPYRNDVSTLMNQKVIINDNKIPISAVAGYEYSTTYDKITRLNHTRTITISSNVAEGYNANQIIQRVRQLVNDYPMPEGYTFSFTGEQQEQSESSEFLFFALLIAIAIITIILVTQFNSLIRPLIIMATVLFSTIGVFLGLGIFNMEFVIIMTGIGIISLAGIVVNNGIVLIDYIDLVRQRKREELGLPEDAFCHQKYRLKPWLRQEEPVCGR